MFYFGDPAETAQLYLDQAFRSKGPAVPDISIEEMTEQNLLDLVTYRFIAHREAYRDGASKAVLAKILEAYAEAFVGLAIISPAFAGRFLERKIQLPGGQRNYDYLKGLLGLS